MMEDFERQFQALHEELRTSLRSVKHASIVSILSLHDDEGGQWIIGDPNQDPARVAARLRCCAGIMQRQADRLLPTEPACDHDWVRDGHMARCAREGCDFVRAPQGDERELTDEDINDAPPTNQS